MIEDFIRRLFHAKPSQRKIAADLNMLSEQTLDWKRNLIPWEEEKEMELLSFNHEHKWSKKSSERFLKGAFLSIYQEPMFVFGFKRYLKEGQFDLYFAATQGHQFIYQRQKARTDFFINGDHVGYITPEWLMYSHRNRLLGRRNRFSDEYFTIVIWDREVAHLRDPAGVHRVNARAFEIVEQLNDKEELLLMSITFLSMINGIYSL